MLDWHIFALFATLSVLIQLSSAVKCYQCSGIDNENPFQCNEYLSSNIDLEAEECDAVYGAKYCIKHTGRYEGGIGAKRFCSSLDLGNYCNYVKQPGDILNYRTCIHTCRGDACNSSSKHFPTTLLIVTLIFTVLTYKILIR